MHTAKAVYCEMLLQILMDYSSLPNLDRLTLADIIFYYEGRRAALKAATKPAKK